MMEKIQMTQNSLRYNDLKPMAIFGFQCPIKSLFLKYRRSQYLTVTQVYTVTIYSKAVKFFRCYLPFQIFGINLQSLQEPNIQLLFDALCVNSIDQNSFKRLSKCFFCVIHDVIFKLSNVSQTHISLYILKQVVFLSYDIKVDYGVMAMYYIVTVCKL